MDRTVVGVHCEGLKTNVLGRKGSMPAEQTMCACACISLFIHTSSNTCSQSWNDRKIPLSLARRDGIFGCFAVMTSLWVLTEVARPFAAKRSTV